MKSDRTGAFLMLGCGALMVYTLMVDWTYPAATLSGCNGVSSERTVGTRVGLDNAGPIGIPLRCGEGGDIGCEVGRG